MLPSVETFWNSHATLRVLRLLCIPLLVLPVIYALGLGRAEDHFAPPPGYTGWATQRAAVDAWIEGTRWASHTLCLGFALGIAMVSRRPVRIGLSVAFVYLILVLEVGGASSSCRWSPCG